jgi:DNA processing protein
MRDMARMHVYRILDRDYPRALRELSSPPDPLCVRGDLLPGPAIAMVGTRDPSSDAAAYAHDLAFRLARRGVTIWSGGALGIDAAAHRGALDAGGTTVAVIGTGLEHCYPPEHGPLYEEIVGTGGALVSPFEPSQHATLTTFPQRNGVLAAMTQLTVVVQAPIKSGARSTARFARRLGRPLFVVPAPPWDAQSAGNLAEVQLGARVLADDAFLFDLLGVPRFRPQAGPDHSHAPRAALGATIAGEPSPTEHLSPECQAVLRMMSSTPLHCDDLCAGSGLSTALVHAALLTLSLEAVLVEGPPGWFKRVTFRKDSV